VTLIIRTRAVIERSGRLISCRLHVASSWFLYLAWTPFRLHCSELDTADHLERRGCIDSYAW